MTSPHFQGKHNKTKQKKIMCIKYYCDAPIPNGGLKVYAT